MSTPFVILSAFLVLLALCSLGMARNRRLRKYLPAWAVCGASLTALAYALWSFRGLGGGEVLVFGSWQMPFGSASMGIDALSVFFLVPLLILATCCALYAPRYLEGHGHATSPTSEDEQGTGPLHWFFMSLLIAAMVLVLLARNAVLFLLAWEVMAVTSFFLVITDSRSAQTLRAGWIYLVTAHVGGAFLLVLFFVLGDAAGSYDFAAWRSLGLAPAQADVVFLLALVAFGMKAGFIPFHVWLPLAHPAAPSHVSALMSGIMIKMGIYGLLRILTFLAPFHGWWGVLLVVLGAVSGLLGVLFAIGQHHMKRLLAYHSVENIGIMLLGMGIGVLGSVYDEPEIALFGFAGALLHVFNHAIFKSLLFLGAGAVIRATGTGAIDQLGGLAKRMPITSTLFLAGSAAICGLPFFNGFVSELFIYAGSILGTVHGVSPIFAFCCLGTVIALAGIGGLAVACFTKIFGVVFLGEPRSELPLAPSEAPPSMLAAMLVLALICAFLGIFSVAAVPLVLPSAKFLAAPQSTTAAETLSSLTGALTIFLASVAALLAIWGILARLRSARRPVAPRVPTWDCGYSRPAVSMQYTASSFAAPILEYVRIPVAAHERIERDQAYFPTAPWSYHSGVNDWILSRVYTPAVQFCDTLFASLRWFQNGKVAFYVLYIVIALAALIAWNLFL